MENGKSSLKKHSRTQRRQGVVLRIGIDLMGSDTSPQELFKAVVMAAEDMDFSYTLVVLATQPIVDMVAPLLDQLLPKRSARVEFHIVQEFVSMEDEPISAIRTKKKSSLAVGIRLLKKHVVCAFISCGNTGALIAASTLTLPHLPGIKRPALLTELPTEKGSVAVLDVGGNVSCKAHHLIQFAKMGAAFQRSTHGVSLPKVGLLNIGAESKKGTSELRDAYQHLHQNASALAIDFCGNVEGREIFQGKVDVLVTDGFTGNVLLKSIEGVSFFILDSIHQRYAESFPQALSDLRTRFHYDQYPGAIVCGLEGLVVKCHGNASKTALYHSICAAIKMVQKNLISQISHQLVDKDPFFH